MEEILKIENLKKCYGDIAVLEDIDLTVNKGEVVVVLGPSGCGKSTLLRSIDGLESIEDGRIFLDGKDIYVDGKRTKESRYNIGMVFQSYELFPHLTVLDNITLAPRKVKKIDKAEAEKKALELLERVGLSNKKDSYPKQLSGGQKQRVAIVRALIMEPEILLLDEITAALDPEMVHEVLEVVLDLAKEDKTMVIVTHEMEFAKAVADRIVFIDGGKIVEENAPQEFFLSPKTERAKRFLKSLAY